MNTVVFEGVQSLFVRPDAESEAARPQSIQKPIAMATKTRTSPIVLKLSRIRWLVALLGSKKNFNWWDCSFLDETGLKFLAMTFPRSADSAALEATLQAGQRVHDAAIGRIGSYHLFRLPTSIQQRLADASIQHAGLRPKEEALEELARLGDPSIRAPEGPVQVGVEKKIVTNDSLKELAAHYHSAFQQGIRCYPYFASQG